MEYRLPIQSRRGNLLLVAIGLVFLLAGTGTLVFALISTWGYAGPTDRAMQLVLLGCSAFGALLVLGGLRNLGTRRRTDSRNAIA